MRTLQRKGNKCTCPYCKRKNVSNKYESYHKKSSICKHLYEVIKDGVFYFYFAIDIDPLGLLKQEIDL